MTQQEPRRTSVDICICTFDRPDQLRAAIRSAAAQTGVDQVTRRIIIADNHPDPRAARIVAELADELPVEITYVHAPARNISVARNACLQTALADWVAFLDDDEVATPHWLAELLAEAARGDWDAVLGPVEAVYEESAPAWIRRGDFHSVKPVWVGGQIRTGYTCNALIRRTTIDGLSFAPEFGRSGGEDLDFFYRFTDRGGRIGFAPEALVQEPAPAARTTLDWLLRRRFRSGQSHGTRLLQRGRRPTTRAAQLAIAGLKALTYGALTIIAAPDPVRRRRFLLGLALHAGVVARLAGSRPIELY